MVLEATILCLDNSEWMRDGDFVPTRMEAQRDSVNLICGAKTQSHPENTVGVLTMAGTGTEVHVTLTQDIGKILTALHNVKIGGVCDFLAGIQVAQLALKHRQNKNQHQRIIVFVGSPITADEKKLVLLGKRLKRNNVAVDVVNFGEEEENTEKLQKFINAVNNNNNSHLVTVHSGQFLSDALMLSPVVVDAEATGGATSGGGSEFEFGVDPNLDPELALALRISLEEDKARQEAQREKEKAETTQTDGVKETEQQPKVETNVEPMDEDDLLAQAIAMSMGNESASREETTSDNSELSEEAQMELAIQMSLQAAKDENVSAASDAARDDSQSMQESSSRSTTSDLNTPDLLSFISNLPGVDPTSDAIQNVLSTINQSGQSHKDEDDASKSTDESDQQDKQSSS